VDTKLTFQGLLNYLEKRKAAGTLSELAGPEGQIKCVFICCDLPYQYIDEYFDKVSEEEFRPIRNLVSIPPRSGLLTVLTAFRILLLLTCIGMMKLGNYSPQKLSRTSGKTVRQITLLC
jgi:hypothetical protein